MIVPVRCHCYLRQLCVFVYVYWVIEVMWCVYVDVLEEWGVSFGIGCNEGNAHVTMVLYFVDLVILEVGDRVLSGFFLSLDYLSLLSVLGSPRWKSYCDCFVLLHLLAGCRCALSDGEV